MLLKEGLQATAFVIVNFALSLSHLVIQHSSGCSCCKSESIDPEERCIGHNTRFLKDWRHVLRVVGQPALSGLQVCMIVGNLVGRRKVIDFILKHTCSPDNAG